MPKRLLNRINFESRLDSELNHQTLARLIARQDSPPDRLLKLAACTRESRCHLDGCPRCGRRARKELVREAVRLKLNDGVWTRACLILSGNTFAGGTLADVNLPALTDAIKKRLERSAFRDAIIIGGWDMSWNTFDNEALGWQLHLYLMINLPYSPAVERHVRDAFRLNLEAMRPSSVAALKEREHSFFRALTYALKFEFSLRSGYVEPYVRSGRIVATKNVRDLPLKPAQQLELMDWLSQYPVTARLILRNLKRLNPPSAKLRLKPLKPIEMALRP